MPSVGHGENTYEKSKVIQVIQTTDKNITKAESPNQAHFILVNFAEDLWAAYDSFPKRTDFGSRLEFQI